MLTKQYKPPVCGHWTNFYSSTTTQLRSHFSAGKPSVTCPSLYLATLSWASYRPFIFSCHSTDTLHDKNSFVFICCLLQDEDTHHVFCLFPAQCRTHTGAVALLKGELWGLHLSRWLGFSMVANHSWNLCGSIEQRLVSLSCEVCCGSNNSPGSFLPSGDSEIQASSIIREQGKRARENSHPLLYTSA